VLHQLTSELDPDVIIQKAVSAIIQINCWQSVGISLPSADGQHWQTRAEDRMAPGELGKYHPIYSGVIGRAYRTGETQLVANVQADPDFFLGEDVGSIGSELAIPISFNDQVLGVMNLECDQPEVFGPDDVTFAQSIAAIIAIALKNAQRFAALQQEIAERAQVEMALRASEEQYRGLMESLDSVIAAIDVEGRFLFVNDLAAAQMGRAADQIVGKTMAELFPVPVAANQLRNIRKVIHEDRPFVSESISWVQSSPRWYRTSIQPIHNEHGQVAYVLINATDIHDLKVAQQELLELTHTLEDRVRERTAEVRIANTEMEHALRTKDEFLANMSHELRTPLNAILALSESLLEEVRGPLNLRQEESIRHIETSGHHLLTLINDILDLSKVDVGRLELQIETVSIVDVCRASLQFVKEIALKKNLQLSFKQSDQLASMESDPKRLKQMLVNLLSNAVKFTPSEGKVSLEVELHPELSAVHFIVRDTGIGISIADMERLFQPFTQLDSRLNRQHEGAGLGLALVQRLVKLHGGSITVESEVGQGSSFMIVLPYRPTAPSAAITSAAERPAPAAPPRPGPASQQARILLAEDNEVNLEVVYDYLRGTGYQVVIARTGREAIEQAVAIRPDVILMDIQMPEMDGLEAIRRLRAQPEFAATPIIALTALAMAGDRERCLAAGASEYLSKPVSLRGLGELLQRLLQA
jgi:PAS domain S-box-containing protein